MKLLLGLLLFVAAVFLIHAFNHHRVNRTSASVATCDQRPAWRALSAPLFVPADSCRGPLLRIVKRFTLDDGSYCERVDKGGVRIGLMCYPAVPKDAP